MGQEPRDRERDRKQDTGRGQGVWDEDKGHGWRTWASAGPEGEMMGTAGRDSHHRPQGKKFVGDLGSDGTITWQETGQVFNSPSAWATHCKRLVNPAKKSGCGWASVRYKGQKLDQYKAAWLRQHQPNVPPPDEVGPGSPLPSPPGLWGRAGCQPRVPAELGQRGRGGRAARGGGGGGAQGGSGAGAGAGGSQKAGGEEQEAAGEEPGGTSGDG